jgi:uncharacterized oxidoreductase
MATFQTIFIIGATSGIGEELARRYHANGKKVIISGRRTERLEALTAGLPGLGSIQVCAALYNIRLSNNGTDGCKESCGTAQQDR